ncbi:nefa-interacting nuclear protein [Plakobranchus ocellatus]|uniref:Nefa-interacting nuclear protein n=1 Tax=Plakobranchus ocellatus TaxID=259542 RepID=A0AAV3ZLL8_9GAST|nr:nefa-interacting nuclear protein [Plakobranchus ocellatus]
MIEHFNNTLQTMLQKLAVDKQNTGYRSFPTVLFALKEIPNTTTGGERWRRVQVLLPLDLMCGGAIGCSSIQYDLLRWVIRELSGCDEAASHTIGLRMFSETVLTAFLCIEFEVKNFTMSGQFKSFVTEEEVQEQRQRRQAEWEKVRKPDDPEECPEEETRSLFDQLKANKDFAEREKEEETKLRSSVKGLDDDEVQFLNFVSNRQMQIEKDRNNEESEPTQTSTTGGLSSNKNSQKLLLQGAIKRKSTDTNTEINASSEKRQMSSISGDLSNEQPDAKLMAGIPKSNGTTMVVAGILPGISDYADDDSSTENESNSSDSEADHMIAPSVVTKRVVQEMIQKLKAEDGDGGCG